MSNQSLFRVPASRRESGFSFLEVLLVLGIVGLMVLCFIGFLLSRRHEPLNIPPAAPAPSSATPAPAASPNL